MSPEGIEEPDGREEGLDETVGKVEPRLLGILEADGCADGLKEFVGIADDV